MRKKKKKIRPYIHPIDELDDRGSDKFDQKIGSIIMIIIFGLVLWHLFDPI